MDYFKYHDKVRDIITEIFSAMAQFHLAFGETHKIDMFGSRNVGLMRFKYASEQLRWVADRIDDISSLIQKDLEEVKDSDEVKNANTNSA